MNQLRWPWPQYNSFLLYLTSFPSSSMAGALLLNNDRLLHLNTYLVLSEEHGYHLVRLSEHIQCAYSYCSEVADKLLRFDRTLQCTIMTRSGDFRFTPEKAMRSTKEWRNTRDNCLRYSGKTQGPSDARLEKRISTKPQNT